ARPRGSTRRRLDGAARERRRRRVRRRSGKRVIRALGPEDGEELAALYLANRDFLAPFEPTRPPEFFTADGQRERLQRQLDGETHPFAILDDGAAIAGTLTLFNIVRETLHSRVIGSRADHA